MGLRDPIVKDSSVWMDTQSHESSMMRDATLKIGLVRDIDFNIETNETLYVVEVQDRGDKLFISCRQLFTVGGVFNFEEHTFRTYSFSDEQDEVPAFNTKPGDMVLIAYMNGDGREGVIVGGMTHPGKKPKLSIKDGPQYYRIINGVETFVNAQGELIVTFRGQPTNLAELKKVPNGQPVPAPVYDAAVGTSYYKFDAQGGWTVSDNAQSLPQSIKIDKAGGITTITSGNIVLTMTKGSEAVSLKTKTLDIAAADKMTTKTKDWATEASATAKIKSPKIAFGTDGVELLDQIVKCIEALGMVKIITPVGPAAPMMAAPEWPQVDQVKSKINSIKGSL